MGDIISSYFDSLPEPTKSDQVNHPQHYGGSYNAYEAIKVIEAWQSAVWWAEEKLKEKNT